jgi:two-component system chemotaxis response regulator CheY
LVKIGIVEDEPQLLTLFKVSLASYGHEIAYTANNGADAVNKNRTNPAPIIIMNYLMPIKDGIEATREILADYPDTKIIMETADVTCAKEAFEAGVVKFLIKPISLKELLKAVEEVSNPPKTIPPRNIGAGRLRDPREDRILCSIKRLEEMENNPNS